MESQERPEPDDLPEATTVAVPAGVTGEVPPALLASVLEDFSARTDLAASQATITIAESVTWSDGSLGCPEPGGVYEQAPLSGYRVLLQAAGGSYDYRLSSTGHFLLCEPLLRP